uniref:Uncharacterized protein n=1 Tax=Anopheles melas TaxID=34690 RepID=A0A182TIN5_9DIPT
MRPPPDEAVVVKLLASNASADGATTVPAVDAADGVVIPPAASTHACQLDLAGAAAGAEQPGRDGEPPLKPKPTLRYKCRKQAPIYLGPDRRQYANPISYLGGPRYDLAKRSSVASSQGDSVTSLNSILSLD